MSRFIGKEHGAKDNIRIYLDLSVRVSSVLQKQAAHGLVTFAGSNVKRSPIELRRAQKSNENQAQKSKYHRVCTLIQIQVWKRLR